MAKIGRGAEVRVGRAEPPGRDGSAGADPAGPGCRVEAERGPQKLRLSSPGY